MTQPALKRRREQREQARGAGLRSDRGSEMLRSSVPNVSGCDDLDAIPLDFFAELDDWLDDSPLLLSDELLHGAGDTRELSGGDQMSSESTPGAITKEQHQQDGGNERTDLHPTPENTRPSRAKPKSSTQRQKEELVYLRNKASELEAELHELRLGRRQPGRAIGGVSDILTVHSSGKRDPTKGSVDSPAAGLWESIAARQKQVRCEAEKERERLQAMLKAQIKLARSLEKMLCKPQVWEQLQEPHRRKSTPATRTDSEIFDELLASVDARYALLETTLDMKGLHRACQHMSDTKLNATSSDGVCIEYRQAKLLPFDFHLVVDVLWRCLREGKLAMFNLPSTIIEHSPDVTLIKSTLQRAPVLTQPVAVYRVVKRFVETDCVRVVAEIALASNPSPECKFPPVQVVHQGWGRLAPAKLPDGTLGTIAQGFVTSVLTILESENGLRSQDSTHENMSRHREIDMLSELIMSVFQEKQMLVQRELETVLIDAALARRSQAHC